MQLLYFGLFDPPHVGHVCRLEAVEQRWRPTKTVLVPLDVYDGKIPGRRIVRTKLASVLADATGALYSDAGLSLTDLGALIARLAATDDDTIVLFDPELPPGQSAEDFDPVRAGVKIIADKTLDLPARLPRRDHLVRAIRAEQPDWPSQVVPGVEAMVKSFGLYDTRPQTRR